MRGPLWGVAALALALAALAVLAVAAVLSFVADERERALQAWQARLAIVADSRAGAVAQWFEARVAGELSDLAANESLQIYMTELALGGGDATGGAAQAAYLRNLLVVVAERAGFAAPAAGPQVPANVRRIGIGGIGLYALDGRPLVATPDMPPLDGALGAFFASLEPGAARVLDLHRNAAGGVGLGYATPVYRIQGTGEPSAQVGWILGLRPVAEALFPLLAQPGEVNRSAENLLIRHRPPLIDYLSPLADGSAPLARAFADNTPGLAEALAVARPGAFVEGRDYAGRAVLAVSRPVAGLPWLVVSKVGRDEALGETEARLRRVLLTLSLIHI